MTLSTLLSKLGVKVPNKLFWAGKITQKQPTTLHFREGYNACHDKFLSLEVPEPGVMSAEEIEDLIFMHTKGVTLRQYGSGKHHSYVCREDLAEALHSALNKRNI